MIAELKSVWQIRLATLSIFLLGFIAGGFALNAFYYFSAPNKQPTKQERYEEAFEQLNLTGEQKANVQRIITELRGKIQQLRIESEPRLQEFRNQNDEKLQNVLTKEQWSKFQKLRENIRKSDTR